MPIATNQQGIYQHDRPTFCVSPKAVNESLTPTYEVDLGFRHLPGSVRMDATQQWHVLLMICALWGDTGRLPRQRLAREGRIGIQSDMRKLSRTRALDSHGKRISHSVQKEETRMSPCCRSQKKHAGRNDREMIYQGGFLRISALTFLLLCVVSAHQRLFISACEGGRPSPARRTWRQPSHIDRHSQAR